MADRAWSGECPCGRVHGEPSASRVRSCTECGFVHLASDVVAIGRFDPAGVSGYRTPDGEVHATREDGQSWLCRRRQVASSTEPTTQGETQPGTAPGDATYRAENARGRS